MARLDSVCMIGPVVWGSVWGHGPELARYLGGRTRVRYFDPIVPVDAATPSFKQADSFPVPAGVEVIRRRSRRRLGILYGLELEWKNLLAAAGAKADCLVTYYPLGSILALLWCRLRGVRSVFVFADRPEIFGHRLARFLARRFCLTATARLASAGCIATSHLLFEDLRKLKVKVWHVPNGVDLAALTSVRETLRAEKDLSGTKKFTAGFVGFFGAWVDFELVLETARSSPEIEFILVGDGPLRKNLEPAVSSLQNVRFTGSLPHREVFRQIAEMDVCLVPFKVNEITHRVSPVKLFEYWAMGKPVLATACEELLRMAKSAPAALRIFSDSRGLAGGLEALRQSPALLAEASDQALRAVQEYDWRTLGAKILEIIEPDLPSPGKGRRVV